MGRRSHLLEKLMKRYCALLDNYLNLNFAYVLLYHLLMKIVYCFAA